MSSEDIEVVEASANDYARFFGPNGYGDIFLTPEYNLLNSAKTVGIVFLVFKRRNIPIAGIIFGTEGTVLKAPFSAPYGGFTIKGRHSFSTLMSIGVLLKDYCIRKGMMCEIIFPAPVGHDRTVTMNQTMISILSSIGFQVMYLDINYHIDIKSVINVNSDLKRRYDIFKKNGGLFSFSLINNDFSKIYDVIRRNHEDLGFQINMSESDFRNVSHIIPVYQYGATINDEIAAGAICYQTRPNILQLIWWGDNLEYRKKGGVMPYLALQMLYSIHREMSEISYLDLGPASSKGKLLQGLCDFKQSLGGFPTQKMKLCFRN